MSNWFVESNDIHLRYNLWSVCEYSFQRYGDAVHTGNLRVILKAYQPIPLPIHAVYRRGRFIPAKVRCLIDFLASEFKLDPWVSDYGYAHSPTLNS